MEPKSTNPPSGLLPEPFRSLEPFGAWVLEKESERIRKRLASSMEELRAFYSAMLPQMEAIVLYLNQFSLEDMPQEVRNLLFLALSFVEVTGAVELYGQPGIRNGLAPERFLPVE